MIKDSLRFSTRQKTPEGFLQAVATLTCVGVQDYLGAELQSGTDFDLDPTRVYRVFRPRDTVFDPETIKSAKMKPVTDGHPMDDVTTDNCKYLSIGTLGDSPVSVSDQQLAFPISITDPSAIQKIEDGTHQVSCGYSVNMTQKAGLHDGKPYDMICDGPMIINHLALVESGRCSEGARILDEKKGIFSMFKKKAKKMAKTKVSDIDTSELISKLVERMGPDVEKLASSPDFVDKVAEKMAAMLAVDSSDASVDPMAVDVTEMSDEDTDDIEPMNDPAIDTSSDLYDEGDYHMTRANDEKLQAKLLDKMKKKFAKDANDKIETLELVKSLDASYKYEGQNCKKMLLETLTKFTDQKLDGKSEDYLRGLASHFADKRNQSRTSFDKLTVQDSMMHVKDQAADDYENYLSQNFIDIQQANLKESFAATNSALNQSILQNSNGGN